MKKFVVLGYGMIGFLLFHMSLIYFIGFMANFSFLPRTLDSDPRGDPLVSILVDIVLIVLFGLQHSMMARPQFKKWWIKWTLPAVERTTYVILASLLLWVLCWYWHPVPIVIWEVNDRLSFLLLWGLFWFGWIFGIFASGLIDLSDLMGLRQVYAYFYNTQYSPPEFKVVSIYRYIRHQIMLGTLIGLWATPKMTIGHLLLAMGLTIYIFIGIVYEENDLIQTFGSKYQEYRRMTTAILPFVNFPKR